jgi:predicted nucleic acid-binding protein
MVFFQAASRPDRTHTTFRAVQDKRVTLALSPELLAEIQDVLNRDSVRAKFPTLTSEAVQIFIDDVLARGVMYDRVPHAFSWPQHPDDDHLFNLAIHAKARFLVPWETRILKLANDTTPAADLLRQLAPDLAIITPKQLADLLGPSE